MELDCKTLQKNFTFTLAAGKDALLTGSVGATRWSRAWKVDYNTPAPLPLQDWIVVQVTNLSSRAAADAELQLNTPPPLYPSLLPAPSYMDSIFEEFISSVAKTN